MSIKVFIIVLSCCISSLLGGGDPSFAIHDAIELYSESETATICASDLDADGDTDVVVFTDYPNPAEVFLNTGSGFQRTPGQLDVKLPSSFAIAEDLNRDGLPDLVSLNAGSRGFKQFFSLGDGRFFEPIEYELESDGLSAQFGDFNGDTVPDLTICQSNGEIVVFINSGFGIFFPRIPLMWVVVMQRCVSQISIVMGSTTLCSTR